MFYVLVSKDAMTDRTRQFEILEAGSCAGVDRIRRRGVIAIATDHMVDPANFVVRDLAVVPRDAESLNARRLAAAQLHLRQKRDRLLAQSDWTQVPDAPVDRAAWARYRQALRELPQSADPFDPVFPRRPDLKGGST
ncbi:Phage tail assembly chaperone protein [Thalassovita litoralis]|uniref:Phage tail assembly chaperone protein n=1 Tax=Thalassovita litoralis TaxID=1010611 RepID=A0A521DQD6_9RHOB|nr:phage tail assembly chaperone [Thalassovita litoralis]SMO73906.1 Phage tail assembly chaperone protein [Thalassovita litoralis]